MSSSEVLPPRPRRRRRWLIILIVLLVAGYSAAWFFAAAKIDERIGVSLARLADQGVTADCQGRKVDGFPLSLGMSCEGISYDDPARNIAFTTGALDSRAAIYNPLRPTAKLMAPLRVQGPDFPPFLLNWDSLTANMKLARPVPAETVIAATGLLGETDPDDETDPAKIFSAAALNGTLSPDGQNLIWNGSFQALQIDPAMIEGRTLPPLDGLADATIINGVTLITDRPRSLRGQAFEIRNLALAAGQGRIAVSGPISIDTDGLIDADLSIKLTDPAALSAVLQQAIPEKASEINTGFMGLMFLGKEPKIPFKIVKGKPRFMGFSLGEIPALK